MTCESESCQCRLALSKTSRAAHSDIFLRLLGCQCKMAFQDLLSQIPKATADNPLFSSDLRCATARTGGDSSCSCLKSFFGMCEKNFNFFAHSYNIYKKSALLYFLHNIFSTLIAQGGLMIFLTDIVFYVTKTPSVKEIIRHLCAF